MPQDKRLIVSRAVVQKVKRVAGTEENASREGVYLDFIIPTVLMQQVPDLDKHMFPFSHPVYPKNGRCTVLIVPKAISYDCSKINKRHAYYDAVITAEAICRRGDADSEKRAVQVANTFTHFVVDARIVNKLPRCIHAACEGKALSTAGASTSGGSSADSLQLARKHITPLDGMEEHESLGFRTGQASKAGRIFVTSHGQCYFRVGHGGMTAGDICENAKNVIFAIKKGYPTVYKFISEFKLSTHVTERLRFMEANITK